MQLLITCTCIYNGEMTATKKNNQVEIKNKVALLKKPNSLFNFITKDTLHISSKNYYWQKQFNERLSVVDFHNIFIKIILWRG